MESLKWWLGISAIVIIYLWSQNSTLHKKVDACSWNIGVMNSSITQANEQLNDAKLKAWNDYETMGTTLSQLETGYPNQENPCDKDFNGDLSTYPRQ